jgi:hypothetical protein
MSDLKPLSDLEQRPPTKQPRTPTRLGDILLQRNLITQQQLDDALIEQRFKKQPLGEILIDQQIISPKQMQRSLKLQSMLRLAAMVTGAAVAPMIAATELDSSTDHRSILKSTYNQLYHPAGYSDQNRDPITYRTSQLGSELNPLDSEINNGTRALGLLLAMNYTHPTEGFNHPYHLEKVSSDTHLVTKLTTKIKSHIKAPVHQLLMGEYSGGVDQFNQGVAYKAIWSNKGVKLNIKYQF